MSNAVRRRAALFGAAGVLLVSSACAIGPKYQRPQAAVPLGFAEALPAGWTLAQPNDGVPRGHWWSVYQDPRLDALEAEVNISNQNVLAAEAQYRAAKAAVRVTRAGQFPTVGATISATRAGTGRASGTPQYSIPIDVTYQADVWGGIRRSVAADSAIAQASAAQLENARLSYQAELAADYFQIQGLDAEQRLLDATVKSYEQFVQLTQDRFDGGVATMADVAQARTQMETVRAQLVDVGIARAQFDHAVAVLTGRPP